MFILLNLAEVFQILKYVSTCFPLNPNTFPLL